MARVTTADLKKAHDVLAAHLADEENDPAVARVADWLMEQITSRNVRKVAREHGLPVATVRDRIREMETR